MKTLLSEFGLAIISAVVAVALLVTCSPISEHLGFSMYDMVVDSSNKGKVASGEVATGEIETTKSTSQILEATYVDYEDWEEIEGLENVRYLDVSGDNIVSLTFIEDRIEIVTNEESNISSAVLNNTTLTILESKVNIPDILIRDEGYYQLDIITTNGTKATYILRRK